VLSQPYFHEAKQVMMATQENLHQSSCRGYWVES
jgi:hypothetical protein